MRIHDSGLAFVCSHLSSGESEGDDQKRNYDYSEIVRRLQFPPDSDGVSDAEALLGTSASGINKVLPLSWLITSLSVIRTSRPLQSIGTCNVPEVAQLLGDCGHVDVHWQGAVAVHSVQAAWQGGPVYLPGVRPHHPVLMQVVQSGARPGQWGTNRGLLAVENTIWMGDLNYRLTMPDADVRLPAHE